MKPSGEITRLLAACTEGSEPALEELMPLVYNDLHRIARHGGKPFQNRTHFFALASTAMCQLPVNYANASLAGKRGGGQVNVSFEEVDPAVQMEARDVIALHAALAALPAVDPRKSRVVELRYFGGLSIEETAQALSVPAVTVKRDWQTARAWLARELGKGSAVQP
jgi:RNA polymerase sigma-70 factor (ECF subfamily)